MPSIRVSALQIGSDPQGPAATVERILSHEREIAEAGASLVVMPEALLGGYPKGEDFGTRLGYRMPEGRAAFARYFAQAIDLDGPELAAISGLSDRTGATVVLGVIERAGSSLFCTAVFIAPGQGVVAKHRKLMPTGTERLVWSLGDGSTMPVLQTPAGRIGAAICWENHMPLFRAAMYAKGVEVWCAPTVDSRDIWRASMRHIAHEGSCVVVSACQVQPSPQALRVAAEGWPSDQPLMTGGSMIVGPLGDVLAGPVENATTLLVAEYDPEDIVRARYDLDVSGHYARPDIFSLQVNEAQRAGVIFRDGSDGS